MSKKTFAPPVVKSYRAPFGRGGLELPSKPGDGVAVNSMTLSPGQSKKEKGSPSKAEKKQERKKNLETIENAKRCCLSDAQFEEIVQCALQKSPRECREKLQERRVPVETAGGQRPKRETPSGFLPAQKDDWGEKTEVTLSEAGGKGERNIGDKDEKAAANNVGCKKAAQDVTGPEEAPKEEEEEEEDGGRGSGRSCTAWVQCSFPSCEKWRRLSGDVDPSALPEDWSCSQNPDHQYNSCSVPEETYSGSEDEVIYAIYFPGSVVWAKQYGYPWWPGMIEGDPDIGDYFLFSTQGDSLPSKYHVTFFGHAVSRAWISASLLKNYGEGKATKCKAKLRSKSEKENLQAALEMAKEAEGIGIQERIRRFGFRARFERRDPPGDSETLKERNPAASGKKAWEEKGRAPTCGENRGQRLPGISGVEPNASPGKTLDGQGHRYPQFGGLENAAPALKKSRPGRTAPRAAATFPGSERATGRRDSSH